MEAFYQYSFLRLVDDGVEIPAMPRQALAEARTLTGLVATWPAGAVLLTGAHTGHMTVVLEAWDAPPRTAATDWDEVATVTYTSTAGAVRVLHEWESRPPGVAESTETLRLPSGPGPYVMRVHAQGRSTARGVHGSADHADAMLVQFWPA